MENKSLVDKFFDFETKNQLFSIKDKNGIIVWDLIRFYVFSLISWESAESMTTKRKSMSTIGYKIKKVFEAFFYFLTHRRKKFLFLISSRAIKDGIAYDRNSDRILNEIEKYDDCFIMDYLITPAQFDYKYKGKSMLNPLLFFPLWKKKKYAFDYIIGLIKEEFPNAQLTKEQLLDYYNEFYQQYYFYRFFLRVKKPKIIFVIQNKLQKGLYLAAKEKGIPVFEIQHGELSRPHLAYSYPTSIKASQVYSPQLVLTYGGFWGSDCFYPGTSFYSIGNDDMTPDKVSPSGKKDILVISADIYGADLIKFVDKLASMLPECQFFYKLHPNEFNLVNYYNEFFNNSKNVTVYSNEKSVKDFFCEVAYVFLVQSTVEFEALSAGVKVISWRHKDYWSLDCLWNEPGVFLINDENEFVEVYNRHKNDIIEPRNDFFEPYNPDALKIILK